MGVWDFAEDDVNELTHGFHLYPAKLNPHIVRRLIKQYGNNSKNLWDPFCGSGTALVEGRLAGLDVYGNDINPTAIEISLSKTQNYQIQDLKNLISNVIEKIKGAKLLPLTESIEYSGLDTEKIMNWFNEKNVREIATSLKIIDDIAYINQSKESSVRFAKMCLSDCIRKVSFQRGNEWKLYRVKDWREGKSDSSSYKPLFPIFRKKINENLISVIEYSERLQSLNFDHETEYHISANDCAKTIQGMEKILGEDGFDLVITSPPYGDSPTTMAYEQFSWLPNVWLGLDNRNPGKLAKEMLGGVLAKKIEKTGNKTVDGAIDKIKARKKEGRSKEQEIKLTKELKLKNYSFYRDYLKSIRNIVSLVKIGGFVCFILGNRISGGQEMRLDLFTDWAFKECGFKKVGATKKRKIRNTRMPKSNPSGPTMNYEYIVVFKKLI